MRSYDTQYAIISDAIQKFDIKTEHFPKVLFCWIKMEEQRGEYSERGYIMALVNAINTFSSLDGAMSYDDLKVSWKKSNPKTKDEIVRWIGE